jgi:hypothetical protein
VEGRVEIVGMARSGAEFQPLFGHKTPGAVG